MRLTARIILVALALAPSLGFSQGSLLGPLAAGGAMALAKNATTAERAGYAFVAGATGTLLGGYLDNRQKQKDLEAYMLGRYQEGYIRAFSPWFTATLDPKTGRPPAFDGYWAMDIGVDQSAVLPSPMVRSVPANKVAYEDTLPKVIEKKEEDIAKAAATTEVVTKKRVVNGVEYAAQRVIYPRLPKRQ